MPEENIELNPQISEVKIGKRTLRKITIYPLSLGDEIKLTGIITKAVSNAPVDGDDLAFVAFIVTLIEENLGTILQLVTDEEDADALMSDITNLQGGEIAEIIYDVNYDAVAKNLKGLFSKIKNVFRLERPLLTSVSDTPDTDSNTSIKEDSETEEPPTNNS